jgi:hypothetical protein
MKPYKEYLAESKKTFTFRVRIADCDMTAEVNEKIETALQAFDLVEKSKVKSLPVSRRHEFANLGPVGCCQFEVTVNYPTIPDGIRNVISQGAGINAARIAVFVPGSEPEVFNAKSNTEDGPILNKEDLPTTDGQDHVGDKKVASFLKELEKVKHGGEQHKGTNDEILAKSIPQEKAAKTTNQIPQGTKSVIGSTKMNNPDPRKGRK